MNRPDTLSPSEIAAMQSWSDSILDAFGVCTRCGAEHEPPRGEGCLFCDVVDPVADTQPAPPMAAEDREAAE